MIASPKLHLCPLVPNTNAEPELCPKDKQLSLWLCQAKGPWQAKVLKPVPSLWKRRGSGSTVWQQEVGPLIRIRLSASLHSSSKVFSGPGLVLVVVFSCLHFWGVLMMQNSKVFLSIVLEEEPGPCPKAALLFLDGSSLVSASPPFPD